MPTFDELNLRKRLRLRFIMKIKYLFRACHALEGLLEAARNRAHDRFAISAAMLRAAHALDDVRPLLNDKDGEAWE